MTWIRFSFLLAFSSLTAFYRLSIGIEFARNETHSLCQTPHKNENFGFLGVVGDANEQVDGVSDKHIQQRASGWLRKNIGEIRSTLVPEIGGSLIYDYPATKIEGEAVVEVKTVKTLIFLHEFGAARLESSLQKLIISMPTTTAVARMTLIRSSSYIAIYLNGSKVGQMGLAVNEMTLRIVALNGPKRLRQVKGFASVLEAGYEGRLVIASDFEYSTDVCLSLWLAPEIGQLTIEQGERRLNVHPTTGWNELRLTGNESIKIYGAIPADTEEGYEVAVALTENLLCHDGPLVVAGAATGCSDEHGTAVMSKTTVDAKFDLKCDGECLLCNENGCKCSGSLSLTYECAKAAADGKNAGFGLSLICSLAAVAILVVVLILVLATRVTCRNRPNQGGYSHMGVDTTVSIEEFFDRVQQNNTGEAQVNILLHPLASAMNPVDLGAAESNVRRADVPNASRANTPKVKESALKVQAAILCRKRHKILDRERKIAAANKILQKCRRIARTVKADGELAY